jgi:hypothetical protein
MPEFLRHHYYHMNVSRFYIMDDATDPPLSTVQDYGIPREALTFKYWEKEVAASMPKGKMQTWIYSKCIEDYGDRHTWMAFTDIDEFLEVRTNETMEEILREFEADGRIGALGVNWRMHTSGGLLTRPESVRKSFTRCFDTDFTRNDMSQDERHVKSIVRTAMFDGISSPHMFKTKNGSMTVGEDGLDAKPGYAWRFPISWNRLALHHYVIKSREEFQQKVDRWKDDTGKTWAWFNEIEAKPQMDCTEMVRYSP